MLNSKLPQLLSIKTEQSRWSSPPTNILPKNYKRVESRRRSFFLFAPKRTCPVPFKLPLPSGRSNWEEIQRIELLWCRDVLWRLRVPASWLALRPSFRPPRPNRFPRRHPYMDRRVRFLFLCSNRINFAIFFVWIFFFTFLWFFSRYWFWSGDLFFKFIRLLLSCICPCCLCVTIVVEVAIELIKAPIHVMQWFTAQIPC